MSKPVYSGLSILDLSKTVMYEFWYDYPKPKYGENVKPFYMDTGSSFLQKQMIFTKTLQKMLKQDLTLQILEQTDRCLNEKNKKVIGLMKDEVGEQIMKDFVGLTTKTYSYLKENNNEDKKAKVTKKCVKKTLTSGL